MKKIILLLAWFTYGSVLAQEKTNSSFDLEQAIQHAIKNNYSAINVNRDIEAAKLKKWETTTMGLPQISGDVSYINNLKLQTQIIDFGGTPTALTFGTYNNMDAKLTLNQLIFDGSYLVGLQSAKTYLKISENAKIKSESVIRELTTNAYGNVLLAEESIKIIEKNKAILEKTLGDTKQIYKNGFTEEETVERLQITLSQVNSSLDYANRMKVIATNMLKLLMGIELNQNITLTEKLDNLTTKNIDLAIIANEFDVQKNIDYQIGKNLETSNVLLLKLEKSKALPSMRAFANFGYNTFGNQFTMFNGDQKWFNYSNLGIGLHVPLFSSLGRSARTQQARIALDQSKTKLLETEQKLKLEYQKAKSDYEYSIAQYDNAKNNLKLNERIESKQEVKFKEGLSTSFEFTEAQRQLYAAQQTYLQSMVDVINKRATIEKLVQQNK